MKAISVNINGEEPIEFLIQTTSFQDFREQLAEKFSINKGFKLKYKDEDDEFVTFSTQTEFDEFLSMPMLKNLEIFNAEKVPRHKPETPEIIQVPISEELKEEEKGNENEKPIKEEEKEEKVESEEEPKIEEKEEVDKEEKVEEEEKEEIKFEEPKFEEPKFATSFFFVQPQEEKEEIKFEEKKEESKEENEESEENEELKVEPQEKEEIKFEEPKFQEPRFEEPKFEEPKIEKNEEPQEEKEEEIEKPKEEKEEKEEEKVELKEEKEESLIGNSSVTEQNEKELQEESLEEFKEKTELGETKEFPIEFSNEELPEIQKLDILEEKEKKEEEAESFKKEKEKEKEKENLIPNYQTLLSTALLSGLSTLKVSPVDMEQEDIWNSLITRTVHMYQLFSHFNIFEISPNEIAKTVSESLKSHTTIPEDFELNLRDSLIDALTQKEVDLISISPFENNVLIPEPHSFMIPYSPETKEELPQDFIQNLDEYLKFKSDTSQQNIDTTEIPIDQQFQSEVKQTEQLSPSKRQSIIESDTESDNESENDIDDNNNGDNDFMAFSSPSNDISMDSFNPFEVTQFQNPQFQETQFKSPQFEQPKFQEHQFKEPQFTNPQFEQPKFEQPQFKSPQFQQPQFRNPQFQQPQFQEYQFQNPQFQNSQFQQSQYNSPESFLPNHLVDQYPDLLPHQQFQAQVQPPMNQEEYSNQQFKRRQHQEEEYQHFNHRHHQQQEHRQQQQHQQDDDGGLSEAFEKYKPQLQMLHEMGFTNDDTNLQALLSFDDMDSVINCLLSN